MKAKDLIKILLIASFNIVFYYIGEKHGRENVICPKPDKLIVQIDPHGEPYYTSLDSSYSCYPNVWEDE